MQAWARSPTITLLAVLGVHELVIGQSATSRDDLKSVVFQNVNLIAMDRERVETGQTVVVQGDRIAAIGAVGALRVPDGATLIDGSGQYLLPGLTDAHVHLEGWEGLRPDFGDAPLYLANGVTTIVNLRGTPTFFEWKRRIQTGELIGPTIYTAGEFIIGPRGPTLVRESGERVIGPNVNTENDVQREIDRQARQGVDVIKFYGGLSLPAYLRMAQAARAGGIPLVGHGPDNLGFDALLQARQPLAHVHSLLNLYFVPVFSNIAVIFATAAALALLIVLVVASRIRATPRMFVATASLVAGVFAVWVQTGSVPFDTIDAATSFILVSACAVVVAVFAIVSVVLTVRICRGGSTRSGARVQAVLASVAAVTLGSLLTVFWVPVAWRSTDGGLVRMASALHEADVPIVSALVTFTSGRDRERLASDPAMEYLLPAFRDRWRQVAAISGPPQVTELLKRVTRSLHQAGVPLIAGTDALGAPLMIPGTSLHHELRLLTESGLTPFEAIRAATVNTAAFLRKDQEFGTITVGKRADLLLVEKNPLRELAALKEPAGVMVRGHWLTREQLQQKLRSLLVNGP